MSADVQMSCRFDLDSLEHSGSVSRHTTSRAAAPRAILQFGKGDAPRRRSARRSSITVRSTVRSTSLDSRSSNHHPPFNLRLSESVPTILLEGRARDWSLERCLMTTEQYLRQTAATALKFSQPPTDEVGRLGEELHYISEDRRKQKSTLRDVSSQIDRVPCESSLRFATTLSVCPAIIPSSPANPLLASSPPVHGETKTHKGRKPFLFPLVVAVAAGGTSLVLYRSEYLPNTPHPATQIAKLNAS